MLSIYPITQYPIIKQNETLFIYQKQVESLESFDCIEWRGLQEHVQSPRTIQNEKISKIYVADLSDTFLLRNSDGLDFW